MKKLLLALFLGTIIYAQGQVCTIDYSQTSPGIYPDTLPTATVGDFYDTDISFLFPTDTMGFDFTNFQIVSVNPPMGLDWECSNDANGCNYDPQADPFGCARVWGTPLIPGQYTVEIGVIADLTIQSGNATSFFVYLEVLPSLQSNAGFSMNPGFGCEDATVDFTNNNPSGNYTPIPNQTQGFLYSWDFGNGSQSTAENPGSQTYTGAGDYYVDYTCIIDTFGFFLDGITINNVSCDDAIGFGEPDIYIYVYDGDDNLVHTTESSPNDNNLPQTHSMNVQLDNPPYYVMVWDDDSDNWTGTADDNCVNGNEGSTASANLLLPAIDSYGTTTQVGSNGGLNFTYDINKPIVEIDLTDTLTIYSNPPTPIIDVDQNGPVLSTDDLGYSYQWYLDGTPISGETSTSHTPTTPGLYTVTAVDSNGCFSTSQEFDYDNVGLEKMDLLGFNMYPNPASDQVKIVFNPSVELESVSLLDLTGRTLINESNIDKNSIVLNVADQTSGVYIVALKAVSGQVHTSKLVIE
ncbi:MAG: T9SS type A sorting domain-containing protein [Brumimicrobium sp.]